MTKTQSDRLPLKTQILPYPKLKNRVQKWLEQTKTDQLRTRHNFKNLPECISSTKKEVLEAVILYSIGKRMPGLMRKDEEQEELTKVAEQSHLIKEHYADLNLKHKNSSTDSKFYFMCVFFTKATVSFLEDTFLDLEIQPHLESEIYITLVFAMLGLEVCPRSYELNLKKFLQPVKRVSRKKNTFHSNYGSMSSLESKSRLKKLGSLAAPLRKLVAKMTIESRGPDSKDQLTSLESFRATLKQNLTVQILPRLPPKLIKASQFDHITELSQASKAGDQKRFIFSRRQNEQVITPPDFMRSTQNSASFELMLQKNKQSAPVIDKTVKISHRPQLMSHKRSGLAVQMNGVQNDEKGSEGGKKCDSGRKNWPSIIQNIRQHATVTSKHHFKSKMNELCDSSDLRVSKDAKIADEVQEKVQETDEANDNSDILRKSRTANPSKHDQPCTLTPQPFPLYTYYLDPSPPQKPHPSSSFFSLTAHNFRKLRKDFDFSCDRRHQEANYSMFNISNGVALSLLRQ